MQALFEQMEVLGANHVWLYARVEAGDPGLGSRDERLFVPGGSAKHWSGREGSGLRYRQILGCRVTVGGHQGPVDLFLTA